MTFLLQQHKANLNMMLPIDLYKAV